MGRRASHPHPSPPLLLTPRGRQTTKGRAKGTPYPPPPPPSPPPHPLPRRPREGMWGCTSSPCGQWCSRGKMWAVRLMRDPWRLVIRGGCEWWSSEPSHFFLNPRFLCLSYLAIFFFINYFSICRDLRKKYENANSLSSNLFLMSVFCFHLFVWLIYLFFFIIQFCAIIFVVAKIFISNVICIFQGWYVRFL